jgi:hypothetical protein
MKKLLLCCFLLCEKYGGIIMGTDVYMEWRKKTKEEKEKQLTGFDITKGNVGYLRASIGMHQENSVLRLLFPMKYWEDDCKDEYDFIGNYSMAVKVLKSYLDGGDMEEYQTDKNGKDLNRQKEIQDAIVGALEKLGGEVKVICSSSGRDDEGKRVWAKSIVEFFKMGMKLQNEGKKPYPYISW